MDGLEEYLERIDGEVNATIQYLDLFITKTEQNAGTLSKIRGGLCDINRIVSAAHADLVGFQLSDNVGRIDEFSEAGALLDSAKAQTKNRQAYIHDDTAKSTAIRLSEEL